MKPRVRLVITSIESDEVLENEVFIGSDHEDYHENKLASNLIDVLCGYFEILQT